MNENTKNKNNEHYNVFFNKSQNTESKGEIVINNKNESSDSDRDSENNKKKIKNSPVYPTIKPLPKKKSCSDEAILTMETKSIQYDSNLSSSKTNNLQNYQKKIWKR